MKKPQISAIEQYVIDSARKLRVKNKMTMKEFGIIIGAGSSFIGGVENPNYKSKYSLKHINLLASHFNISPKEFLPREPMLKNDGVTNDR